MRFVKNSKLDPKVISRLRNWIPTHITHSGGIKATAIATPAMLSDSFLNPRESIAIIPEARAIKRSTVVGEVLIKISSVISANGTVKVTIYAVINATKKLITSILMALI